MTLPPERLAEEYREWLSEQLRVRPVDGALEITTPFVDRHNDCLQIYAVWEDDELRLTDGGHTVRDLKLSGMELNTPKRRRIVGTILSKVSVEFDEGALLTYASNGRFATRLQALVQAMLAVNDMYVLAQPTVARLFDEDVRAFLDQNEVKYKRNIRLPGRSGYEHNFDFLIPPSDANPPRLVEAMDSPTKQKVDRFLWTLTDTEVSRPEPTKAYAFLNDTKSRVEASLLEALRSYAVTPAPWSEREQVVSELVGPQR